MHIVCGWLCLCGHEYSSNLLIKFKSSLWGSARYLIQSNPWLPVTKRNFSLLYCRIWRVQAGFCPAVLRKSPERWACLYFTLYTVMPRTSHILLSTLPSGICSIFSTSICCPQSLGMSSKSLSSDINSPRRFLTHAVLSAAPGCYDLLGHTCSTSPHWRIIPWGLELIFYHFILLGPRLLLSTGM